MSASAKTITSNGAAWGTEQKLYATAASTGWAWRSRLTGGPGMMTRIGHACIPRRRAPYLMR